MKNVIQKPADVINATAPTGGTLSGAVLVILSGASGLIGVALADIAAGVAGPVAIKNYEVELAAVNNAAFSQGDKLYWDASAGKLTKTSTGNTPAGRCAAAKASTIAKAKVILGMA